MKPEQSRKYTVIAIYALAVLLLGVGFVFVCLHHDTVGGFFSKFFRVCAPLLYGALLAYLLNPLMMLFENKVFRKKSETDGLSRTARRVGAVILTCFSVFIVLALFVLMLWPQLQDSVTELFNKFPDYLAELSAKAAEIMERNDILGNAVKSAWDAFGGFVDQFYQDFVTKYLPEIREFLTTILAGALDVVLGVVFAIYFLLAKEHLASNVKKLLRALVKEKTYHNVLRIVRLTDETFGKYFTGVILDSMLVGVICFIAMTILRLPYAPLISVIIGCTNIIPFFGPFIGAIPSAIILFVANPLYAIYFGVMILVLQQIDGNIIAPRIQSASTGMDPVWVIVAITVMSGLLGFVGMVIGVPLFSVLYTLLKEVSEAKLAKKNLPVETEGYMSEMGRAYCEKPEKEQKPIKETALALWETWKKKQQIISKKFKKKSKTEETASEPEENVVSEEKTDSDVQPEA